MKPTSTLRPRAKLALKGAGTVSDDVTLFHLLPTETIGFWF